MASSSDSTRTTTVLYVIVVVVAVLIGTVLAPVAWDTASNLGDGSQSTVAVVTLEGTITASTADHVIEDLRDARRNESVEAVVMKVDSGGGAVAPSERLFLEVQRTAEEMPVVASVTGGAASGAYYAIAPADRIFVQPGSEVGSIGVYAQVPTGPNEVPSYIVRSAPDKATMTRDQIKEYVEMFQNAFVSSVMEERGDELELSREEVSHARVYLGPQAVQNGFADETGDLPIAIDYAASQAGLGDDYTVVYKEPPQTGIGILLAEGDNGEVVLEREEPGEQFQTVEFYAHRGIPKVENDSEVIINGSE